MLLMLFTEMYILKIPGGEEGGSEFHYRFTKACSSYYEDRWLL